MWYTFLEVPTTVQFICIISLYNCSHHRCLNHISCKLHAYISSEFGINPLLNTCLTIHNTPEMALFLKKYAVSLTVPLIFLTACTLHACTLHKFSLVPRLLPVFQCYTQKNKGAWYLTARDLRACMCPNSLTVSK